MENTEFLSQLREQTEGDVQALADLIKQAEQIKKQTAFLKKRIASSNEMLTMGGQQPVKS